MIRQHTRRRERRYEYFLCHRGKAGCPQRKALPVIQVEQRRLKAEHAKIILGRRSAATDLADLEDGIRGALDLLQDAHAAYERSPAHIRKQLNRTLFPPLTHQRRQADGFIAWLKTTI